MNSGGVIPKTTIQACFRAIIAFTIQNQRLSSDFFNLIHKNYVVPRSNLTPALYAAAYRERLQEIVKRSETLLQNRTDLKSLQNGKKRLLDANIRQKKKKARLLPNALKLRSIEKIALFKNTRHVFFRHITNTSAD